MSSSLSASSGSKNSPTQKTAANGPALAFVFRTWARCQLAASGSRLHWIVYLVKEGMEFASDVANDEELDCV